VRLAEGGRRAVEQVDERPPSIIVLDVAMPDLDGVAVTSRLRSGGVDVPICILSARDEISDRVAGLEAGADDYLVKPFALEELVARMHALLRRVPSAGAVPLRVGELTVDPVRRIARGEGASSS
jgi:two-component system, OmpR family, response regulator PrrA